MHNSYVYLKVLILFCALVSLKPNSAELYLGQIAPKMSIGVFLYRIEIESEQISE